MRPFALGVAGPRLGTSWFCPLFGVVDGKADDGAGTAPVARREGGDMTGAIAPTKPLSALDLCDRCGAQAYVRVVLAGGGELLFCAHHWRQHGEALARVALEIQAEPPAAGRRLPPSG